MVNRKLYWQKQLPVNRLLFPLINDNCDIKNKLDYLRATGMAFQREIIKENEQPFIQGNEQLINAINIVWVVPRISRTPQNMILH